MSLKPPSAVVVGDVLSIEDLVHVSWDGAPVSLGPTGRAALGRARAHVEPFLSPDAPPAYGINTGFGALAEVRIDSADLTELQHRLIRSHSVGVGAPLGRAETRGMMLMRAHVLALGYSGVRPVVVDQLLSMLNVGVHPVIPSKGSVGASGDLAPLAHLALVLIGEGKAEFEGDVLPGAEALARAGLAPLTLEAKEGLSLINGTQGMLSIGSLALMRAERLAATADVTGAMSLEALKGSAGPFDAAIIEARPHAGALAAAAHLRALLADSAIAESHVDCNEVQDAYSLRCMPQVHGAARDALQYVRGVLEVEMNSATDNPLVLPDGRIQSGGNFHGQPVAAALDFATIAVTDLASIAERRLAQLVDPSLNRGLPPFLAIESGLNSGFMMAQVTAAALVSESKALSHPKSVDSIPTSADREDHVSMGMMCARHFDITVSHLGHVLAIEAVVAREGIRQRGLEAGTGAERASQLLATVVPPVTEDRAFHEDFDAARALVLSGQLLAAADGT
jgi:histidine ammonia-lyase